MQITDIALVLAPEAVRKRDAVLAFVKVVFDDCFAVREMRLMRGNGHALLCMPSRKLTVACGRCGGKTAKVDKYCTHCGNRLRHPFEDKKSCYSDVAFPINSVFRGIIERAVVADYNSKVEPSEHVKSRG